MKRLTGVRPLMAMAVVFLAACSGDGSSDGSSEDAGVVNVYSHRHYDTDQELFRRFTELTGIRVNVQTASADELITRLETEGADTQGGDTSLLTHPAELALIRKMLVLPELVESIAYALEPHHLPHYAQELATTFHDFYERCRVVDPDNLDLSKARLRLAAAAKSVLASTLGLMGMSTPDRM